MVNLSTIALSGMNAAQMQLNTSAHNIANINTTGFKRQEVTQTAQAQGGVSTSVNTASVEGDALVTDVVTQLQAKHAFIANLAVFKTHDKLAGALLDKSA
ncbi:MAG: flagellar basal body rod protein [Comamonadaceae bacterium]|nr:MAG: flagellar basal body rod protein [Comamonadaceae bacterium]